MNTYPLTKLLKKSSDENDKNSDLILPEKLNKIYDSLTGYIESGDRVLDIGCGTGFLTIKAASRGAKIKGIDVDQNALDTTAHRAKVAKMSENIELCKMDVKDLAGEEPESYDVVMSGFCFSELTEEEILSTLKETKRLLKTGGVFLLADVMRSQNALKRAVNWTMRAPMSLMNYVTSQKKTGAVKDIFKKMRSTGFYIETFKVSKVSDFIEMVAKKM